MIYWHERDKIHDTNVIDNDKENYLSGAATEVVIKFLKMEIQHNSSWWKNTTIAKSKSHQLTKVY